MTLAINVCDKIIKTCLYLLVFSLPIFYLPWTAEALEFNKQNLLIILSLVALLAWFGKMIASKKLIWRKNIFNLFAFIYLGVYFFSAVLSADKFRSIIGSTGIEKEGFITVLCLFIFYLVAINNIYEVKDIKKFLYTFLFGSFVVSIFSFLGLLHLLPEAMAPNLTGNTIGSLAGLGIFVAINLIITSILLFDIKGFLKEKSSLNAKLFLAFFSILNLTLLVIIDSKKVWTIAVLGASLVLAFLVLKAPLVKNLYWTILPGVILLIAILLFFVKTPLNLNLPAEITPSLGSSVGIATKTLEKNPLLGSGPGTFAFDYAEHKSADTNKTPLWNTRFNKSSSDLVTTATTTGLLGFASWVLMALFLGIKSLIDVIKNRRDEFWLLQLTIFFGWIVSLFSKLLYSSNLTLEFTFWFFSALLVVFLSSKIKEIPFRESPRSSLILSFLLTIGLIFVVSTFCLVGQRYLADSAFKKAIEVSRTTGDTEEISFYFSKATTKNRWNDLYFKNFSQSLLVNIGKEISLEVTEERTRKLQQLAIISINAAKQAAALSPNNAVNWNTLASTYQIMIPLVDGSDDWAITSWQKAISLEPNNPIFYNELGKTYVAIADMELNSGEEKSKNAIQAAVRENLAKAEENFTRTIELKNNFVSAHFQLSLVYSRQGKIKTAIQKLEAMRYSLPQDIGVSFQLGLLYYQNKEVDKAIAELNRTLELAPEFANANWYLATIYEEEGDDEKAITALEKILLNDPENQAVKDKLEIIKNKTAVREEQESLPDPIPETVD